MGERSNKKKFTSVSNSIGGGPEMKPPVAFRTLLKQRGYSDKAVKEIWKWYDSSERKEVNL